MADPKRIKEAFERNRRAVELGPQKGKSIQPFRNETGYEIPGEFVIVTGQKT
jgi:hypothetical protein